MTFALIIFFMTCWWYAGKYLKKLMNRTIRLPPILKSLAADGVTYFIVQVLAFPLVNSPLTGTGGRFRHIREYFSLESLPGTISNHPQSLSSLASSYRRLGPSKSSTSPTFSFQSL